jgi:transcriptional regulator with XRE-family HTH domain
MMKPEHLTEYRRRRGNLSMEQLAVGLGMAKSQIVNLEQGHTMPRRIHALALIGLGVATRDSAHWKPRQPSDDDIAAALAAVIADTIPRFDPPAPPAAERPAPKAPARRKPAPAKTRGRRK